MAPMIAVELWVAREASLEAGHAEQDKAQRTLVVQIAHLFESGHLEPIGLANDHQLGLIGGRCRGNASRMPWKRSIRCRGAFTSSSTPFLVPSESLGCLTMNTRAPCWWRTLATRPLGQANAAVRGGGTCRSR
jgi:hypothetical protein